MLLWLRVRNLALLRDVSVEFDEGLHVLTGETGAGKSLLLESLGLALGARGRARQIGPHGDRTVVEAGFQAPASRAGSLSEALDEAGVPVEDGELVIRRVLRPGPGGRTVVSRASLNGSAIPVGALRRVGALLAEVYGQGEHLALLRPGAAREAVDGAGGHHRELAEVRAAHQRLREAMACAEALAGDATPGEDRRALEAALREIEAAAPEPGEKEALLEERTVLGRSERLLEGLGSAWEALYGSDRAAGAQLAAALRELEAVAGIDPATAALLEGRPDLVAEVEDLAAAVRDRRAEIDAGPERLAWIEDRLALLRRLERRHTAGAGGAEALLARAEEIRTELASLGRREAARAEAAAAVEEAAASYRRAAWKLSAARGEAALELSAAVLAELPGLGLTKARFEIRLDPRPAPADGSFDEPPSDRFTAEGWDRVAFRFSANPELPPAPLAEVASGGESSRFFLALKAAGAGRAAAGEGSGPTLVFDEVDAGTSGRVADAVGRRLRRLSGGRQVLCVTHLPQVAALAGRHLRVEKLESDGSVRVRHLRDEHRTEEIARMLAGPEVTDAARDNARDLLRGAASPGDPPRPREAVSDAGGTPGA